MTFVMTTLSVLSGQYHGDQKPNVNAHIKINSFADRVVVQRSKTHPKLMTIRGDDGNEYRYLVKYGEDLRCVVDR